ncbi:hypothetical protein ACFTAO_39675 [Paenibacillus rhizoplanae]
MTLAMPLPAPYQHLELAYNRDISGLYAQQQELNRFFVMINWIVGANSCGAALPSDPASDQAAQAVVRDDEDDCRR